MNLKTDVWKPFYLTDLYDIQMGNGFDKNKLDEDNPEVNLVSRVSYNNGVDVKVGFVDGVNPFDAGLVTVALGGSYLGSCFVQEEPFYTGQNVAVMKAKYDEMTHMVNVFISGLVRFECKTKYYAFGRELNTHIRRDFDIKLPVKHNQDGSFFIDVNHTYSEEGYVPDWQFMEDYMKSLHHKPLTTGNSNTTISSLNCHNWKDFLLFDYFDILPGKYHYPDEYDEGTTPYYSASNENNGIGQYIDLQPDFEGNCIVTGKIGCTAFYVPEDFCATSDVNIFKPKFNMTNYVGLFIATVINFNENYKWAYGRQCRVGNSKKITIKLPVDTNGNPNWQFMEDYIKSLPYGDRL